MRSRGNLWAQKVWLGLYDCSRLGLYDAKDDEGLRSFIIDKYEKKRYVVLLQSQAVSRRLSFCDIYFGSPACGFAKRHTFVLRATPKLNSAERQSSIDRRRLYYKACEVPPGRTSFFYRYYVDPSTIRHSLSNSSSSGSTGIEPPPLQAKPSLGSGLIGATLNSRVQQKQQQQQQPNISVSRPGVGISNGSARFALIIMITDERTMHCRFLSVGHQLHPTRFYRNWVHLR